jgi:CheY-like chemotaxis protein
VRTLGSPEEALAVVESFRPHVLISDVGMPGEDGYRFMQRLRAAGDWISHLPCIAVTALSRPEDREQALEAGYDEHVGKPFDPGVLCMTILQLAGRNASSLEKSSANRVMGAACRENAAARDTKSGRRVRVLLAEDSPHVAEILRTSLEERDYEVIVADTVDRGVEIMRTEPVDVLVSDLRLKGGMGWDLLAQLRGVRDIPGIMMSGYSDSSYMRQSRQAGFSAYLIKPVDPDEVAGLIDRLLQPSAATGQL